MTPDLATFSKGMANSYAVSALVDRADVMDSLKESRFSSTFFTNTSEMAAAIKTIECIREKNVVPYIWKLGGKLMDGLREIIKVTGVEAEMIGVDIMPYIIFNCDNTKWISPTGFSGALPDGFVRVPHPKQDSSISRDSAPETARFPMYFSIYFSLSNS